MLKIVDQACLFGESLLLNK